MTDGLLQRYEAILARLRALPRPVIINTVYDPTDGKDDLAVAMGLPQAVREPFDKVNDHIRGSAGANLHVSDLEVLFAGHSYWSNAPWITGFIEPNLAGASAIAQHWFEIFERVS